MVIVFAYTFSTMSMNYGHTLFFLNSSPFPLMTTDNTQKISRLDGAGFDDSEGLKKNKQKIKGD